MICTARRPKTRAVYFPHVGNILNDVMNAPMSDILQKKTLYKTNPGINFIKTEDNFLIEMAVPGHSKEDISISVENDVLTIKSIKSADSTEKDYRLREFNYSGFKKKFDLGETIDQDKISALFNNGILTITLDKKEEHKPQPPKSISIK